MSTAAVAADDEKLDEPFAQTPKSLSGSAELAAVGLWAYLRVNADWTKYSPQRGWIKRSHPALAKAVGISEPTLRRLLCQLEELGYLDKREGRNGKAYSYHARTKPEPGTPKKSFVVRAEKPRKNFSGSTKKSFGDSGKTTKKSFGLSTRYIDVDGAETSGGTSPARDVENPAPESGKENTPAADPDDWKRRQCQKHQSGVNDAPCRPCGKAREKAETEDAAAALEKSLQEAAAAKAHAAALQQTIDSCDMCDKTGYLSTGATCLHDPTLGDRSTRGAALARAAIHQANDRSILPELSADPAKPAEPHELESEKVSP